MPGFFRECQDLNMNLHAYELLLLSLSVIFKANLEGSLQTADVHISKQFAP